MDERIDVLDEHGEKTGRIVWKSEAHRKGLWHRCFHCWIFSPETELGGPYLFVQRRASGKETWPDRLDVTVGGHLGAGEKPLDGLREVEEELGLNVEPDELIVLGTRRAELQIPAGLDREFQDVFLLARALAPKDLCLQEEEVASVVSLRLADVEALCEGVAVRAEDWADGERRSVGISLAELVPGEDGYLLRVAYAARAVLAGGLPEAIF